jgi:uncharacterized protein
MNHNQKTLLLSGASGFLFALGLVMSGMTQPSKVLGFLDLGAMATGPFPGGWDPSLAFVMGGAVLVTLLGFGTLRFEHGTVKGAPWLDHEYHLPHQEKLDGQLVAGAAVFGVGWGLAGYCPGPAIASLLVGGQDVLIFVPTMLAGMWLARRHIGQ